MAEYRYMYFLQSMLIESQIQHMRDYFSTQSLAAKPVLYDYVSNESTLCLDIVVEVGETDDLHIVNGYGEILSILGEILQLRDIQGKGHGWVICEQLSFIFYEITYLLIISRSGFSQLDQPMSSYTHDRCSIGWGECIEIAAARDGMRKLPRNVMCYHRYTAMATSR